MASGEVGDTRISIGLDKKTRTDYLGPGLRITAKLYGNCVVRTTLLDESHNASELSVKMPSE